MSNDDFPDDDSDFVIPLPPDEAWERPQPDAVTPSSRGSLHISLEGKSGIGLALLALLGAGAMMVWPDQRWIGWALMITAATGGSLLALHHAYVVPDHIEKSGGRSATAILMVLPSIAFFGFAVWYFWPVGHKLPAPHEVAFSTKPKLMRSPIIPVPLARPIEGSRRKRHSPIAAETKTAAAQPLVAPQSVTLSQSAPQLKRLIAYQSTNVGLAHTPAGSFFHSYVLGVSNVGDDTINMNIPYIRLTMDGTPLTSCVTGMPLIVEQTQTGTFPCPAMNGDVLIPPAAKTIIAEFEVDYDTIPPTGQRRSYRKFRYNLDWANGPASDPLLEKAILDEWEK